MPFTPDTETTSTGRFKPDTGTEPTWQEQLRGRTRQAFGEGGEIPGLYPAEGEAKTPEQRAQEITGATGAGAALGYVAPKLFKAVPYAPAKAMGAILEQAPAATRALGGAFTGLTSEAAGQAAEYEGAGRGTAEAARLLGGGGAGAVERLVGAVPGKIGAAYRGIKKLATGGPEETMSEATRRAVGAFRGEDRTAEPAGTLYEQMRTGLTAEQAAAEAGLTAAEREAGRATTAAERAGEGATLAAERRVAESQARLGQTVGRPAEDTVVGNELRDKITQVKATREAARETRFEENKKLRDAVVGARESAGQSIADLEGYQNIIKELRNKLLIGKEAKKQALRPVSDPGTLAAYNNIYEALVNKRVATALDEFGNPTQYKVFKNSFEAVDDVRRKLADVAFGKEVEGYKGISTNIAKDYWKKLADLQLEFAGERQLFLLKDYEADSKLLNAFKMSRGEAATATESFDAARYVKDPSALPKAYFSSKSGVDDLLELTGGDAKLVDKAARSYAAKQLEGKDATQVGKWIKDNSDFLSNPNMAGLKNSLEAYKRNLEVAERGTKFAKSVREAHARVGKEEAGRITMTAEQAVKDAEEKVSRILKSETPAKLFSEMLTGADPVGNIKIVAQYVAKDPAGQKTVERAVRQAVADVSPANIERQWINGVRPAMEGSGLMSPQQLAKMDNEIARITATLAKNPRATLKWYQNIIYNALLGEAASVTGRGAVSGYNTLRGLTNPMGY